MKSAFEFIQRDLASLSIQTELLEYLDWDEDALQLFTEKVSEIISGPMIIQDNYEMQLQSIKRKIVPIAGEKPAELIIKLIRNHEEEIINFEKENLN
tara:strand:- start:184 stop:474 length:291 start_codon:yes stop_codon:yes gene_type:complete